MTIARTFTVAGVAAAAVLVSRPRPPSRVRALIGDHGAGSRHGGVLAGGRARRVHAAAGDPGRRGPPPVPGRLAVAAGVGLVVAVAFSHLAPGLLAGVVVWHHPRARRWMVERRRLREEVDGVPDVIDLLRVAIGAGLNVRLAVEAVVRHGEGVVVKRLAAVLDDVAMGSPLAVALDRLDAPGGPAYALGRTLAACERDGAGVGRALDRLGDEARTIRRRRAEAAARTVPVKLLFPLVFCMLPAFGLLTVVPLLARSLTAIVPPGGP